MPELLATVSGPELDEWAEFFVWEARAGEEPATEPEALLAKMAAAKLAARVAK